MENWLDSLSQDQLKAIAKEARLLKLCGNQLKLPRGGKTDQDKDIKIARGLLKKIAR